jgi:hypothetical protein
MAFELDKFQRLSEMADKCRTRYAEVQTISGELFTHNILPYLPVWLELASLRIDPVDDWSVDLILEIATDATRRKTFVQRVQLDRDEMVTADALQVGARALVEMVNRVLLNSEINQRAVRRAFEKAEDDRKMAADARAASAALEEAISKLEQAVDK